MTRTEYDSIYDMIQSDNCDCVLLALSLIVTDSLYDTIKNEYKSIHIDNSGYKIGDTIGELCQVLDRIHNDNSFMKSSWNAIKDTFYIPLIKIFLESTKEYFTN